MANTPTHSASSSYLSMSNKTLSTGTLNLRFMQNALRRQHLQGVELERAEVQNEGKWEVGRDVKEAWGIEQGARTKCVLSTSRSRRLSERFHYTEILLLMRHRTCHSFFHMKTKTLPTSTYRNLLEGERSIKMARTSRSPNLKSRHKSILNTPSTDFQLINFVSNRLPKPITTNLPTEPNA